MKSLTAFEMRRFLKKGRRLVRPTPPTSRKGWLAWAKGGLQLLPYEPWVYVPPRTDDEGEQ